MADAAAVADASYDRGIEAFFPAEKIVISDGVPQIELGYPNDSVHPILFLSSYGIIRTIPLYT